MIARALPRPAVSLMVLVVAAFLLGGGSRHDIASLALLRPLAALLAAAGLMTLEWSQAGPYRVLFALLGALALLMIAQLVPLPPATWSALPERTPIHALDRAVGLAGDWRPLTLSPMKTANALAALIVPFAALVLFAQVSARRREQILVLIVGIAVTSAVLGMLQQLSDSASPLFLYDITNRGDAVGLFANRNHHAVFLCCALLVALHLWRAGAEGSKGLTLAAPASAAVLFLAVIANASRAGLICLGAALVIAALALVAAPPDATQTRSRPLRVGALAALLVPAGATFALFAALGRSPALARLLGDSELEEYRAQIFPELLRMVADYQPLGSGFGAFEFAFRMRESVALLRPAYLNNAHNDWLQWIIEGGIPAALLGLVLVGAIAYRIGQLVVRRGASNYGALGPAWLGAGILLLLGIASLVDYPLRVPSIMVLATIACAMLIGPDLGQGNARGLRGKPGTVGHAT